MNIAPIAPMSTNNVAPNFKGGVKPSMISQSNSFLHNAKKNINNFYDNKIVDNIAKHIVTPIINSNGMSKLADKMGKSKNMASHMSTIGSFVTTAFYIRQTDKTLNKDAEERKRAKTLELNQGMVTVISTILGYTVNGLLDKSCAKLKNRYEKANNKIKTPNLSTKLKGFDIAKQLLIFSLMYRYIAPVFVTPLASKISKVREAKKAEQAAAVQNGQNQVAQQPKPQPQKVEIKTQNATKTA